MNEPSSYAPTKRDSAAHITQEIITRLFQGASNQGIAFRLWDNRVLFSESGVKPRATLVLTHPGALRRMFFPPGELTLGEAYLRGDFDIEGDIFTAMAFATVIANLTKQDMLFLVGKILSLPNSDPPQIFLEGRQRARLQGARHSPERDRTAVTYHYDTGNEFYRLFLGKWMAYSCAYFSDPRMELDAAQEAKLEHICRKLRLRQGDRLLDIGCGWGGLVVYAAEKYGVKATGITLSEPQVEYGNDWIRRAGLSDRARVEVRDYRDLGGHEPFDKIVSVGMFEHVGQARQKEYFQCAFRALRDGGLFLNHGIALQASRPANWFERGFLQSGQFSNHYVFPDGELLQVSQALSIAESVGFEVRDVEGLREHYALTLRNWVKNLEANREQALHLKDERTYRTWRLFMSASAYGFESGQISVFQALLSKSAFGKAELPLTRKDLYAP